MSDKILVTGASGFVGACLSENLVNEGKEVAVVTRNIDKAWRLRKVKKDVKVYNIDLCNEDSVNNMIDDFKPNKVFHLATYGGYYFQNSDKEILANNIFSTFNMVNALKDKSFDSFINVGSSSEYGKKKDDMSERDILEPINTYGVSKATSALYCRMMASNYDMPIATVRLFSPYGYYEDKSRLFSSVILSCINGDNPKLASGAAVRDFIFIEDAIEMMKEAASLTNIKGKIYNCGTGEQHSVKEAAEAIIKASGKNLVPQWGNVEGRKSDTDKWEADMSLVFKDFKWRPKYTLYDGVKKDYKWYEENLSLYLED